MLIRFKGVSAVSDFKAKQLLGHIKRAVPEVTNLSAEYVHFVKTGSPLASNDKAVLERLLTYDTPYNAKSEGEMLLVVPRPGTISPWSSKATAIAKNSNLSIERIERGTAYYIKSSKKIDQEKVADFLYDRMTETVLDNLKSAEILFKNEKPRPLIYIDILSGGIDELKKADMDMGLALSEDEIAYLYSSYRQINRNPTDLELMMFGVVNSEHCRHKIFNADWYIDGQKQPKSLFKMIKNTYEKNPGGVISAYSDNSAVVSGHEEKQLRIHSGSRIYQEKTEQTHLVAKVETHNHPTAIAPFPGAATGSGGEIRDENATGRGARAKMGLTGFSVSNLHIPGFSQPWESGEQKPERISSALEIMIKGPLGGASFNNEFGRPNTAGYFRTFESAKGSSNNESWGYHKPIMIAGGVGSIKNTNIGKQKIPAGAKLVVLGGPAMLIGLAGGAASSMGSGESSAELDFASVQRGNAEMQRRAFEVLDACANLQNNPVVSLHDVGAGGLSNALTELVNDAALGAEFEIRDIDCAEPGLSPMEIWCNEAQERYVLAIEEKDLETFKQICERERCPYSIVGQTTTKKQLVIKDSLFKNRPADIPMSLLFGGPPKITKKVTKSEPKNKPFAKTDIKIEEAAERVLQIPAVGSKKFLITIGDRTVGGLIARDQMVGPWQVPVSDVAVSATGFQGRTGEAMAMGERTPLATVNAPASARMAIAEAITNIAASKINKLSDIKLSANWMAAAGYESEDYNLYQTVKAVGEDFCPALGLTIPVGKDSLSMRTTWEDNGKTKSVVSPVSLIISAFSPVSDIGKTLTPQLERNDASVLLFIDLAGGKTRLGGSALAQAYGYTRGEVPDIDSPGLLKKFFDSIQSLSGKGLVRAYHDRSDGGLLATLSEMAFAGRTGVEIDLSNLPGTNLEKLFNEEAGVVIQVSIHDLAEVKKLLSKRLGKNFYEIGFPTKDNAVTIKNGSEIILKKTRSELESLWAATSYQIQKIRDNTGSADEEYRMISDDNDPGISPKLSFKQENANYKTRPKIAILREQGVNGQNEMAAAFYSAGFTPVDVHMKDLIFGDADLKEFKGMAVCGGFSYGDVLGAGQGWAKGILTNTGLKDLFKEFFERKDTFSLGVCNGCQMLSSLKDIIPGAKHWPKFLKNSSEQFEARVASVKINDTKSIFFKGMEGSVLPIPVAHGEGRAVFETDEILKASLDNKLVPLQFVDNYHKISETYPLNPNGSKRGITGLSSGDGRVLIMMPHPERGFLTYQHSWHPADWPEESPWLQMFKNARKWVEDNGV